MVWDSDRNPVVGFAGNWFVFEKYYSASAFWLKTISHKDALADVFNPSTVVFFFLVSFSRISYLNVLIINFLVVKFWLVWDLLPFFLKIKSGYSVFNNNFRKLLTLKGFAQETKLFSKTRKKLTGVFSSRSEVC